MSVTRVRCAAALGMVVPLLAACSDLFRVTNPGPTDASDLNNPAAAPALVSGIAYQLSTGIQGTYVEAAVVTRELTWAGSANKYDNGGHATSSEDDGNWSASQAARWLGEHGVSKLQTSLGSTYASSPLAARANLLAGFANRVMGENFCKAVIDGGPAQDRTVFFQRAAGYFNAAMHIDSTAGDSSYITAAIAGRAAVQAWLGNWSAAATDAALVPIGFEYDVTYNGGSSLYNNFSHESNVLQHVTIYNSLFAADSSDPRSPSTATTTISQDGVTPYQAQLKYANDTVGIPLSKGTEMLTLRAEAALRSNDIATEINLLNQVRAYYNVPGGPLPVPPDAATAWADLRQERGLTLWLEGRRLWDLGRWFAATGPEHDDTLNGRSTCLPIGATELATNPNLGGH